ncbi:MAG: TonB-dependent receptor [Acidobacteriota bacterium]|nr:TonB-dependent receptor [Acidobacteriota bacterium]
MKKVVLSVLCALVMFVCGSAGFAQSQNGSIAGVVTDVSGAVVAGAQVTVVSVQTGAVRTTTTTGSGDYNIQQLPPQDYKITVTSTGFASSTATLNVSVGSANTVNVKLSAAGGEQTIEVAANSLAGINLETAENSQVVNTQQIMELPTETRDPYTFVAVSGSVSADPSATNRGVGFNISGARSSSTEILLNGVENTYLFSVSPATAVPVDAVQEYRVITSNFGPEYGRASGGVVNVVTKSGTNSVHGTAWEFYRPSTFASNSYDNNANHVPLHRFVRNAFGYSVGAPIIHDKLFGYSSTEWTRVRSSNVTFFYIPTSQFIAASNANTQGFFSAFGTVSGTPTGNVLTLGQIGACGLTATATCTPPSNAVSTSFNKDKTTLETNLPTVFNDNFPVLQQVRVTVPADAGGGIPQDQYVTLGRVDFNPTQRTTYYAQYVLQNRVYPTGTGNVSPYAGYSTGQTYKSQNLIFGITHQFSARFTSQLTLGGLRVNNNQPLGANPAGPTLFINSGVAPAIASGQQLVFPGYSETNAGNGLPSGGPQNNIVISPVFTLTKGRHTFTFGGQYTYIRDNHTFAIYENAQESLVVSGNSGALVNLQAGVFNYFQANLDPQGKFPCTKNLVTGLTPGISTGAAFDPSCTLNTPIAQPNFSRSNRYHEGAGYFNDSWKATPRLTLTAGLRYELFGTQHNKNSALDSNFYFGTTGTLQDRIRAGKILQVNSAAPAGVQNPGGKLWNVNKKQFAPRIGFALDVFGDAKTSLRGGYGISYERNFGNVTYNVALNPPAQLAISFTNADVGASIPISTGVLGAFSQSNGPSVQKAIPPGSVRAVDPRIKPAYAQFYTLGLEHQVNQTLVVGAAYTGTRGIHNYSIANYNRTYYGQLYEGDAPTYPANPNVAGAKPTVNTNRLNPQYSSINVRGADGDSYYNGVNAFARGSNLYHTGITFTANYTYSHSTDNTSSTFTDGQSNSQVGGVAYFDPYNHGLDHGNSDFDVKHRISVGLLLAVPVPATLNYFEKQALGGWEFGGIFQAATGTPYTMYDCGNFDVTACPRAFFRSNPSTQRTGNSKPIAGQTNLFDYMDFPAYNNTNYVPYIGSTVNRTGGVGAGDLPTIVGGLDTFPGMSARNAFRGPGTMSFDANLNKNFHITERVAVQLRAELYNVLNHANAYLNFGGTNDVSSVPYVETYKNGPGQGHNRQLQLAGKIIF